MKCKLFFVVALIAIHTAMSVTFTQAQGLPKPQVKYLGKEDYVYQGQQRTKYKLAVVNRSAYAKELFQPAPELPPCGLNKNAWRASVDIYNKENNKYIYGYCDNPNDDFAFVLTKTDLPPKEVFITITDRKTNTKVTSNTVIITPLMMSNVGAAPATPQGQTDLSMREALYFTGTKSESIDIKNDPFAAKGTRYNLSTELAKGCVKDVCEFNVGAIGSRSGAMAAAVSTYGFLSLEDSSGAGNTIYFEPSAASKQLVVPMKLKMGKNRVTFTIDPYKKTVETNENNNAFSVDVIVMPRGSNKTVKN